MAVRSDEQEQILDASRAFVDRDVLPAASALDHADEFPQALLLMLDAARRKDSGERADLEAGMAKLFATEAAQECVLEAMRIHGGYGYSQEYVVERLYGERRR